MESAGLRRVPGDLQVSSAMASGTLPTCLARPRYVGCGPMRLISDCDTLNVAAHAGKHEPLWNVYAYQKAGRTMCVSSVGNVLR